MMRTMYSHKRKIALFLLLNMLMNLVIPLKGLAITSGPAQPEMQGFQSIGSSDMVDLFTGDFKYNIPLMDVGGYPLNLSYSGGSGVHDEASWVGNGWTLSPGVINRDMKALPDDFKGDEVTKEQNLKEKKRIGVSAEVKTDIFGREIGKKFKGNLTLKASLFRDNYYGWSADIGVNAGMELATPSAGLLTTGLIKKGSFDVNISGNSREGASLSPAVNFSYTWDNWKRADQLALNMGFDYNTRQGMQSQSLGISYSSKNAITRTEEGDMIRSSDRTYGGSFVDNGVMTYTPTIDIPRKSSLVSFSFHGGAEVWGGKVTIGFDGSYSKETITQKTKDVRAYGYLYADEALKDPLSESLVDMNREKDIPYFRGTPIIPIPVMTNDNFMVSSHNVSGQFKLYRSGSGIAHDPYTSMRSTSISAGADIATINALNAGAHVYLNSSNTTTGKWQGGNSYRTIGDYKAPYTNTLKQHAVFKQVGEMTESDASYAASLVNDKAVRVRISATPVSAQQGLEDRGNNIYNLTSLESGKREKRSNNFSYLTAKEASLYGLDRNIYSYPFVSGTLSCELLNNTAASLINRVDTERKPHHISEITILDKEGQRMIYGIPVYNTVQEEVTFAMNRPSNSDPKQTGIISYNQGSITTDNTDDNQNGRDNYYSSSNIPPYATSFLLTGLLSANYQDITGNGITADDNGDAIKFNYSRLAGKYHWRTPYGNKQANYNEGLAGDDWDDKGNYTYGQKEVWYVHSIESKNFVALFHVLDREDALGVTGEEGGQNASLRLKKLDRIVLYSKEDLKKNGNTATPIKTVHFDYDYSTGSGYPNNVNTGSNSGKLTLLRVYFTYGKNQKGQSNPYQFFYKQLAGSVNPAYAERSSDRWGIYKDATENPNGLTNTEYPYTLQNSVTDDFAGLWNLEIIKLPSGGEIKVAYESDEYAYVQDKPAAVMYQVHGVADDNGAITTTNGFINARWIVIKRSTPIDPSDFDKLVSGKFIYGKFYLNLRKTGQAVWDYVPGYAEIDKTGTTVEAEDPISGPNGTEYLYKIKIKKVVAEGLDVAVNPIAVAAWQYLRNNLPHKAYPAYETNNPADNNPFAEPAKAIRALAAAIGSFGELFENFNARYNRLVYANQFDAGKSWVRLTQAEGKKKGGGHRVKKITLNDKWGSMVNDADYEDSEYGQIYEYTTDEGGKTVSSGVAAYEPEMGGDENCFKTPVFYTKSIKWGLDYNSYMEEPLGESYMPAATVGYRKVTVRSFGASNATPGTESENKIGFTENEFYTARDFPTIVSTTGVVPIAYDPKLVLTIIANFSQNNMVTSQGVSVVRNDMHGKPKVVKTFDKNKNLLSSVEYQYKVKDAAAVVKTLNNEVELLRSSGNIARGTIGEDIEFYTDMRYQSTVNAGIRVGAYTGFTVLPAFIPFPLPIVGVNIGGNVNLSTFNSASTVKLITRYGILEKVTKIENGSSATTENLVWDPETGEVLLTRTNNEFDEPVYSLNYPAHWYYKGMGPAYQNNETVLEGISTVTGGADEGKLNGTGIDLLYDGDELIDITADITTTPQRYWVLLKENDPVLARRYLVNNRGILQGGLSGRKFRVIRSGYRNISASGMATIVSLKKPIVNGKIHVDENTQVLDAKAIMYKDEWVVPLTWIPDIQTQVGLCLIESCNDPSDGPINPYFHGVKGVWRPHRSYVYQVARQNDVPGISTATTGILSEGYYKKFEPFILFTTGEALLNPVLNDPDRRWLWSQQAKCFNRKGQETESEDALERFTSVIFGHNDLLPVAVGKNSRFLELFYDGFEDYNTSTNCCTPTCYLNTDDIGFYMRDKVDGNGEDPGELTTAESHSGKYSIKIASGKTLSLDASTTAIGYAQLNSQVNRQNGIDYYATSNDLFRRFMPQQGIEYVLSFWVKEVNNYQTTEASKLNVSIDGGADLVTNQQWPMVEKWKRIEIPFTTSTSLNNISFDIAAEGDIYLDDIRVFPVKGQMKSFAYDDVSQRLMAELDENNFATFFEYDDEGTLVRVKKETERGIKTIKESRQYIRRTY